MVLGGISHYGKLYTTWNNLPGVRFFKTSNSSYGDSKPPASASNVGEVGPSRQTPPDPVTERIPGGPRAVPTALDKKFLVWTGQFKSAEEIPKHLDANTIHRARSWGRIRINIGFLLLAAGLALVTVYSGKQAAARGESVLKKNMDWHRQVNEEYKEQQKAKKE